MADNSSLLGGRMPMQQRRTDVPTLLRGLGAAATGQVPQFRQQMRAEQTQRMQNVMGGLQLEDALTKSAAQDALKIQQLAKTGDTRQAMDILGDRVQLLQQIGADTTSTMRLADSLMSGGFDAILPQINSTVEMGVRTGMIEPFGGQVPSTFRSLQLQAEAAGLVPGTPDYQEFMSYRGFEGRMGAAKTINYKDGTFVTKPRVGPPEVYDRTGTLITDPTEKQRVLDAAIQSGIVYETEVAAGRQTGQTVAERTQDAIQAGIDASQRIPKLREAMNILGSVGTGGMDSVVLAFKQRLGITSADESKLIYELSKNVLSQLKPTFGAAFTAREGDLLQRIEANTGMSTEGNKALLQELIDALQLDVQRGRLEAKETQDTSALNAMEGYLNQQFQLETVDLGGSPADDRQVLRFDTNGDLIPD
tara:strand:- start:43 stop:1302 length:1260 start_codon:yes stop_codon:yes gene_type:complete